VKRTSHGIHVLKQEVPTCRSAAGRVDCTWPGVKGQQQTGMQVEKVQMSLSAVQKPATRYPRIRAAIEQPVCSRQENSIQEADSSSRHAVLPPQAPYRGRRSGGETGRRERSRRGAAPSSAAGATNRPSRKRQAKRVQLVG